MRTEHGRCRDALPLSSPPAPAASIGSAYLPALRILTFTAPAPSRVGQYVAAGIATERSVTTRPRPHPHGPWRSRSTTAPSARPAARSSDASGRSPRTSCAESCRCTAPLPSAAAQPEHHRAFRSAGSPKFGTLRPQPSHILSYLYSRHTATTWSAAQVPHHRFFFVAGSPQEARLMLQASHIRRLPAGAARIAGAAAPAGGALCRHAVA